MLKKGKVKYKALHTVILLQMKIGLHFMHLTRPIIKAFLVQTYFQ